MNVAHKLVVPASLVSSIKSVYAHELDHVLYIADGYAYLFAHGSKQGLVAYKGAARATSSVLKDIVDNNSAELTANGVKVIYTVSCYGGLQDMAVYKGVTMTSVHNITTAIYVSAVSNGYVTFMSESARNKAVNGVSTYIVELIIPASVQSKLAFKVSVLVVVYTFTVLTNVRYISRPPP